MSTQVTQSTAANIQVILSKASLAVTGLTFADVTCEFSKAGGAFAAKTLDGTNFTEIGNGVYTITFTAAELDTLGSFTIVVTGATIDQYTLFAEVVAADTVTSTASLETCVVSGHVANALGLPEVGASVSARVIGLPSIEQSVAAVTDDLVTVTTNANGEFFITLIRLADVEVFIPAANYRKRLVVPNEASVKLFDIP